MFFEITYQYDTADNQDWQGGDELRRDDAERTDEQIDKQQTEGIPEAVDEDCECRESTNRVSRCGFHEHELKNIGE